MGSAEAEVYGPLHAATPLHIVRVEPVRTPFSDVEIIHHGRALRWVSGADYCADALRILADRQHLGVS